MATTHSEERSKALQEILDAANEYAIELTMRRHDKMVDARHRVEIASEALYFIGFDRGKIVSGAGEEGQR